MPPPTPQPIDVPFPIKGIDRSSDHNRQPPFTTRQASNVRGQDKADRLRGGKRPGIRKASAIRVGPSTDPRITGLFPMIEARGVPQSGANSTAYPIDDDFSTYTAGASTRLQGGTVALAHSYIQTRAYVAAAIAVPADYSIVAAPARYRWNSLSPTHAVGAGLAARAALTFGPNYPCTGDVEVRIRANGLSTDPAVAGSGWGPAGTGVGVGAYIRGSTDRRQFVVAYLISTGVNMVQLVIDEWNGSVRANLNSLPAFGPLVGGAAFPGADPNNLQIRIIDIDATTVQASIEWGEQGVALTTLNATSTLARTNPFGGIARVAFGTNAAPFTDMSTVDVTRLTMTRLAPEALAPILTIDGAASGAGNFFLPPEAIGVYISDAAAYTESIPTNVSASNPDWPAIENGAGYIVGTKDTTGSQLDFQFISDTLPEPDEQYGIDYQIGAQLSGANPSAGGVPVCRISTDYQSLMHFDYEHHQAAANLSSGMTGVTGGTQLAVRLVEAMLVTETDTSVGAAVFSAVVMDRDDRVRVTDDGSFIRFYVNGILRFTYTPTAAMIAALTGNTRIGIGFPTSSISGTGEPRMTTARIVPGEVPASTNVAEVKSKVLVLSSLNVNVLDLLDETMNTLTTTAGLSKAIPQAVSFNRKWYCVDGDVERIVDPNAETVVDWAGAVTPPSTLPADQRLIARYRNRIILARGITDPTEWFASRTNDPLDWDFGADPQSTTSIDDSTGDIGHPGDAITALITWEDDYLVFGCATTMEILEGDPGYQGTVQLLTAETGVAGPRAFTFDHKGALYFLGGAGAFRIRKGTREPEPISGKRMAWLLDRIDLAITLVELTFDAFKRHVHFWLTPTDGTDGTHAVYDVEADAWWTDTYPTDMQPFGACNITGNADEDRRWLIGGDDGYVRRPGEELPDDDGTAIDSWVEIGPFTLGAGGVESLVQKLEAVIGATTTGAVTWYWFTDSSAEGVMAQDFAAAVATGTWADVTAGVARVGWQDPVGLRQRDAYHKIRIRQNSATLTWSFENARAHLVPRSQRGF